MQSREHQGRSFGKVHENPLDRKGFGWSGCRDLNPRPSSSRTSAEQTMMHSAAWPAGKRRRGAMLRVTLGYTTPTVR